MHNSHVVKYYRWLGWVKEQQKHLFGSALYYGYSWDELVKQASYEAKDL